MRLGYFVARRDKKLDKDLSSKVLVVLWIFLYQISRGDDKVTRSVKLTMPYDDFIGRSLKIRRGPFPFTDVRTD